MKVSFSFGVKSTAPLVNTLKNMADNIEFYSYESIGAMIKEAELRHLFFDRIVFSEKIISNPRKDLEMLDNYIKNNSDSTEIVFVANPKASKCAPVFSEIFNSPLYTPVILQSPTPTMLLELVQGDILELKTKYYVLDVKKQEAVVTKNTDEKPKKKGFFGGKRKNRENVPSIEEPSSSALNGDETVLDKSQETEGTEDSIPSGLGDLTAPVEETSANQTGFGFGFSNRVPVSGDTGEVESGNSEEDFEDEGLGIGDFGSQHSDTGFLDEEAEAELEKTMATASENEAVHPEPESVAPVSSDATEQQRQPLPVHPKPKSKVYILTGERGSGVTQLVVDKAANLVEKRKSVLVVDLDYKENGVLSLIDMPKFYSRKCQNGISNIITYSEDGVDFISNGYGSKLDEQVVNSMLTSLKDRYDVILIDCPVSCLGVLPVSVLEQANIMILAFGERCSLISTSLALTDRNNLTLEAERYIMRNCSVKLLGDSEYQEEDLSYVKGVAYFPNGSWLERIS